MTTCYFSLLKITGIYVLCILAVGFMKKNHTPKLFFFQNPCTILCENRIVKFWWSVLGQWYLVWYNGTKRVWDYLFWNAYLEWDIYVCPNVWKSRLLPKQFQVSSTFKLICMSGNCLVKYSSSKWIFSPQVPYKIVKLVACMMIALVWQLFLHCGLYGATTSNFTIFWKGFDLFFC